MINPHRKQYRDLNQLSDEDLMSVLQNGEPEALNILQRRHGERIYHYLLKFTRDVHAAEDLRQETFLRVYRSRHSYRRIAKFTTWLFTIAGNLARTEYRKRQRGRFILTYGDRGADGLEWEAPDERHVPEQRIDQKLEAERVVKAIDRLPERFKEVVILRGIEDLTYDEIQQVTGIPLGTVKSRIHRGRTLLIRMLAESAAA